MLRRGLAGISACALGLVLFASGARAAVLPAPESFQLPASNGFHVRVFAHAAGQGQPSQVYLIASKKGSYAGYVAAAKVTPTSFSADFGPIGHVDVSFHPTSGALVADSCGGPIDYQQGYYEGTIEFHGESGFADVSSNWANAKPMVESCDISWQTVGGRLPGAELSVFSFEEGAEYFLQAYKNRPDGKATFRALALEASGDVAIVRSVRIRAGADSFDYSRGRQVTVDPPAPFSGLGKFRQRKGPDKWNGDLTVDFPGRADVSLVSDHAFAFLSRHSLIRERPR